MKTDKSVISCGIQKTPSQSRACLPQLPKHSMMCHRFGECLLPEGA